MTISSDLNIGPAFTASAEKCAAESKPLRTRKKRPNPLSLRLSEAELEQLKADSGVRSINGYIREKLFGPDAVRRSIRRRPPVDHAAIAQLLGALGSSRLASNMNQIAKAANIGALPVTPELSEELHAACADIRAMRKTLITALDIKAVEASEDRP